MKILEEAKEAKTIGISGHTRPDGDCVGSVLALYLYLRKNKPEATIHAFLEKPPEMFSFLAGFAEIRSDFSSDIASYDVFFALDSNKERLDKAEKHYERAKKKIFIDHHISNIGGGGDISYISPDISSTCEVLYDLMEESGGIDKEIAEALFIGIIHDTGVFRFASTTARTLEIAAKLMAYGLDSAKLISETYYEKTYLQNQVLGRAVLESIVFMDGRCIVSSLDRKTMDFYGVKSSDLEGIVNQLLITKGVECAIFMHQTNNLEYKVSLRSKYIVDVSKVAAYFGGGGHVRAAGVTMKGTFHDIANNLAYHIEEQLKDNA
jgi:phosphoesterase RecJ-like protein